METNLPRISAHPPHAPRVASSGRTHSSTRETLLRLIEAQPAPVTIAHLAALSGCHENTVRGHLRELRRDRFIDRTLAPSNGQGRPSWLWHAVAPVASPAESPYAGLAIALADGLAATGADAPDRARAVGEQWGRTLAASLPPATSLGEAHRVVMAVMQDQGFAPHDVVPRRSVRSTNAGSEAGGDETHGDETHGDETHGVNDTATNDTVSTGKTVGDETHGVDDTAANGGTAGDAAVHDIRLKRCPLVAAATHRPDIVCAVHLGLVAGTLESIGTHDAGSTLIPMSGPGECTLTLRVRS